MASQHNATIRPISSALSPREILATHFKGYCAELPIQGGWGYTKADACIIDKNDPMVDQSLPFEGVRLEYKFIELRAYEELIVFLPEGDKYAGIKINHIKQSLLEDEGKYFDKLVFEVTAFKESDWDELKAEFEGQNGYGSQNFDLKAHEERRLSKMVRFSGECWFDITSFYGQPYIVGRAPWNNKLISKSSLPRLPQSSSPVDNFEVHDKEKGLFSVLGLVAFNLYGPYPWYWEDVNEDTYKGTTFYAYEPKESAEDVRIAATLMVVDATLDHTEPLVSLLKQPDIPSVDDYLHEATQAYLLTKSMELSKWGGTTLNRIDELQQLVTSYTFVSDGNQQEAVAFRTTSKGRKVVVVAEYDVSESEGIGSSILNIIRNMNIIED